MKKTNINVNMYSLDYDGEEYIIMLMPNESDNSYTEFYIKEKQSGIISLAVGIQIDKLENSVEEFINNLIGEWVYCYRTLIEDLETSSS